jgi:hypothetical protein
MMAASLNHPNIVPVLRSGEVAGLPYFLMPYIPGESLRARLTRGPLSVRQTTSIMKDVARALAYAHERGIVHRDIKPDNILLSGDAATVTDFGVAKAIVASRKPGAPERPPSMTGEGITIGTPLYMAPEQAVADPTVNHSADLYALGAVAYEMLVGTPPFGGRSAAAVLAAHARETPTPIERRRYDVPRELVSLIMQCLEKEPERRPKSGQLPGAGAGRQRDLGRTAGGLGPEPAPVTPPVGGSRPGAGTRGGGGMVALLSPLRRRGHRRHGGSGGRAAGRWLGRRADPADPAGRRPRGRSRPLACLRARDHAQRGSRLPGRLASRGRRPATARCDVCAGRHGPARAHPGAGEPPAGGREPRLDHVGDRAGGLAGQPVRAAGHADEGGGGGASGGDEIGA